jgi:tol-pal system protein YbgF
MISQPTYRLPAAARKGALGLFCAAVLTASPAFAQQALLDSQAIGQRMEKLERDLQTLSRQVYRGQVPTGAAAGPATTAGQGFAAEFELRLQTMESGLRDVTGQVERLRHDIDSMNSRLDRALADIEYRLDNGATGGEPQRHGAADPAVTAPAPRIARPNAINNVTPPAPSGQAAASPTSVAGNVGGGTAQTLGVMEVPEGTKGALPLDGEEGLLPGAVDPGSNASRPLNTGADAGTGGAQVGDTAPATPVNVSLPEGDAATQYEYAFGLLKRYQFDEAAAALTEFLKRHPDDPLAANAQFWLGETHFVNGDYREAAVAFATGYEKFPNADKSPENLLKLGMSLGRLGQKNEACMSLQRLGSEYPNAPGSVKQQAAAERRDLGCGEG